MKISNIFFALLITLFSVISANAQDKKTLEFKVTGNCSMCKKTIESAVKGKPGIYSASWNKDTKIMKVSYDPSKVSEDTIHQYIADAGYDTQNKKASDKAYGKLPECCQYKRTLHK